MLLEATNIGINEAVAKAAGLGDMCIASHIDRHVYSIIYQLVFISPEISLAAVLVTGPKTIFHLEQPTFAEIKQAFAGQNLRKVVV